MVGHVHGSGHGLGAALRYAALAVGLLAAGYGVLRGLTGLGIALLPAKVVTEALLFATSYEVQRRVVFRPAPPPGRPEPGGCVVVAGRPAAEHEVPRARPRG